MFEEARMRLEGRTEGTQCEVTLNCHLSDGKTHMLAGQLIDLGNPGLSLEGGIKIDVKLHRGELPRQDLPGWVVLIEGKRRVGLSDEKVNGLYWWY